MKFKMIFFTIRQLIDFSGSSFLFVTNFLFFFAFICFNVLKLFSLSLFFLSFFFVQMMKFFCFFCSRLLPKGIHDMVFREKSGKKFKMWKPLIKFKKNAYIFFIKIFLTIKDLRNFRHVGFSLEIEF
jgi:hypothetical protein